MLSAKCDAKAFGRFRKKVLKAGHTQTPGVIIVDKHVAYPPAVEELKKTESLSEETERRHNTYLNNPVEPDHRNIKRLVKPSLGFGSFHPARRILNGDAAMAMIRARGQIGYALNYISQESLIALSFARSLFQRGT